MARWRDLIVKRRTAKAIAEYDQQRQLGEFVAVVYASPEAEKTCTGF